MTARAITAPELAYLRSNQQWSRLFLAGVENPPAVFACRVNQTFSTHDKVAQITYDQVTTGAYTDALAGMTVWVGSAAGLYDLGQARIRKAATSTILYIGHGSEIVWADDLYLTVVDEMGLWVKHPNGINLDYDVVYTNQHTVFDPIVIMGANVVKDVEEYPVTVTFPDAVNSSVIGSTISAWAWTANAGTLTDETTNDPTLTINSYPANGLIRVALTLTSAAGKSFTGYRYIRVYDATHRPVTEFNLDSCDATIESGGFGFTVTLYGEAAKTSIRDRAPVTVFARDYYGGTQISLGQAEGRENIVCAGWVVGESVDYDPLGGSVTFTAAGAQYWLDKSSAFPLVLEIAKKSPTKWNQMPGLTVDRALWHLCHWRSTISAIMDVTYTDDARLVFKSETVSSSLWEQLKKISKRIFAAPFVDQYGRLTINIHPQMIPPASRTWAVLQDITKLDWVDSIAVARRVISEAAMVSLTGKKSSASGSSVSYYSLSNGHIYRRFGNSEMIDDVIVESQSQSNELTGLYAGWKNNELAFGIKLAANNRLVTLMPNQFLSITIDAADNERGIAYEGNLVLRGVSFNWDPENYILLTEISCEAETFAEPAINGDIPNDTSGVDMSIPPIDVEMPAMPALPSLVLPPSMSNANHPTDVVIVSSTHGVLYTTNFDEEEPEWKDFNAGLTSAEYNRIGKIVATPNGKLCIMCDGTESGGYAKIYYANALGGIWRLLKQADNRSGDSTSTGIFHALGYSPVDGEKIAALGSVDYVYYQWHTIGRLLVGNSSGIDIVHYPMTFFKQLSALLWTQNGWNIFCNHIAGPILAPWGVGALFNSLDPTAPPEGIQPRFDLAINNPRYYGCGCGSLKTQFYWSGGVGGYAKTDGVSDAYSTGVNPNGVQAMAASPTANKLMASNYAGGNHQAYRSPDGGDTWELLTAVIPLGMSVFENCGDDFRWIFGGGTNLKLTVNFGDLDPNDGTSYYSNKEGNLGYVAPLVNITQIRFIK